MTKLNQFHFDITLEFVEFFFFGWVLRLSHIYGTSNRIWNRSCMGADETRFCARFHVAKVKVLRFVSRQWHNNTHWIELVSETIEPCVIYSILAHESSTTALNLNFKWVCRLTMGRKKNSVRKKNVISERKRANKENGLQLHMVQEDHVQWASI